MEIGIWGDSITYGEGDTQALGWVGRFRKSLLNKDDTQIYNFGVCGDTTKDLLERFALEADSIHPNLIIFAIGINDSKYAKGETSNTISLNEFKENMQLLIEQAKTYTQAIYLISATKVENAARPSGTRFSNEDIRQYYTCLKELSQKEKIAFIDVFTTLDSTTDLYDGLHPNAKGYEKLFAEIASQITVPSSYHTDNH